MAQSGFFIVTNMYINVIRENKTRAKNLRIQSIVRAEADFNSITKTLLQQSILWWFSTSL